LIPFATPAVLLPDIILWRLITDKLCTQLIRTIILGLSIIKLTVSSQRMFAVSPPQPSSVPPGNSPASSRVDFQLRLCPSQRLQSNRPNKITQSFELFFK